MREGESNHWRDQIIPAFLELRVHSVLNAIGFTDVSYSDSQERKLQCNGKFIFVIIWQQ